MPMIAADLHYTTGIARVFGPILRPLHQIGFFDAGVFLTVMTVPSIALFLLVRKSIGKNKPLATANRLARVLWLSFYFFISWLALNSLAVGFKTMIVEEIVYQERKWFEPYLPAIHFYITSACLAYLALIVKSKYRFYDLSIALYLQIALIVGYATAGYRALNEDRDGAIGGWILLAFFAVCNFDLILRLRASHSTAIPNQAVVEA